MFPLSGEPVAQGVLPLGMGERWHTSEQLQNDLERQAVLQRLGWVFARIRGSLFFRDPDRAMKPIFAKLEHLGIEPLGTVPEEVDPIPGIKRRTTPAA